MTAKKLANKLFELTMVHGDFEVLERESGSPVTDVIFSDEENVPDLKTRPWFEIILANH